MRRQRDNTYFHCDSCPTSIIINPTTPRHTIVNIPQIYSLTPFQPPFARGSPNIQTKTQATQTDLPTPSPHRQCKHPELQQYQPKPPRHQAIQPIKMKPSGNQAMQPIHMKPARDYSTQWLHMKPSGDHNMQPTHMKPSRRQIAPPMREKPPTARRPMLPNNKRSRRRRPRHRVYHPTLPSKYPVYDDMKVYEIYLLMIIH